MKTLFNIFILLAVSSSVLFSNLAKAELTEFYNSPLVDSLLIHQNTSAFNQLPPEKRLELVDRNLVTIQKVRQDFAAGEKIPLDDCCSFEYRVSAGVIGYISSLGALGATGYTAHQFYKEFPKFMDPSIQGFLNNQEKLTAELVEALKSANLTVSEAMELGALEGKPLFERAGVDYSRVQELISKIPDSHGFTVPEQASKWDALKFTTQKLHGIIVPAAVITLVAAGISYEAWKRSITGKKETVTLSEDEKQRVENFLTAIEQQLIDLREKLAQPTN